MKANAWMIPLLALIILGPAIINGFPLVYSDTGTYILSGFTLTVPADRPVGYGLFLRIASLNGLSIWPAMFVQALLCAIMVWRCKRFLAPEIGPMTLAGITLLVSSGSALGWYGGRIMPDILTAVAVLAVLLQFFAPRDRGWLLFDCGIVLLACMTHLSNIPILGVLIMLLLVPGVMYRDRYQKALRRMIILAIPLAGSIFVIKGVNHMASGDARLSTGGHVFILGRLMDAGLLEPFLDRDCLTHDHFLCDRQVLPKDGQHLLWSPESPMNGPGGWPARKAESDALLSRFFSDPGNAWDFILAGIRDTGRQLTLWGLEHEMISTWYRADDSAPTYAIRDHLPHELEAYQASLQNGGRGELRMEEVNMLHHLLLALAILAMVALFIPRLLPGIPQEQRSFLLFVLAGILLCAGSGAALSIPHQRFLARGSWMLPLVTMFIVIGLVVRGKPRNAGATHAAASGPRTRPEGSAPSAGNVSPDVRSESERHHRS